MRPAPRNPPAAGAFSRRFSGYTGLFFDEFDPQSAWIREKATVQLPPIGEVAAVVAHGQVKPHPDARGLERPPPRLEIRMNGAPASLVTPGANGSWATRIAVPPHQPITLEFRLRGVGVTNFLAWLGRVTGLAPLQRFRTQSKNRQLRVGSIATEAGEIIFDFSQRDAPYSAAFAGRHTKLGLNIVGFLTAELGVGESARCMVRAADAAEIPAALVPLKLNCKNRLGDLQYVDRLQEPNPHEVNVIHVDPPASRDIDHHHGPAFRAGKYNIGYFAWELPEFPDAWRASFDYYDEIWCPSDFTTAAVALKSPVPVLTMPHAISFGAPAAPPAALRPRFGLPAGEFLFLTLFDLNSYSARKNPQGVIDAFRRSGLAGNGAALVVKVQNVSANPADFAALQRQVRDLPGVLLLTETLLRTEIYALEAACDSFVSLHRSEGFGLAVAESMFLGKPVIATNWSATAEYVTVENGCPVRARIVTLQENHGPYAKGSTWAEPDVDQAAAYMRTVFADRSLATTLGAQARATIERRFAPAVIGARYRRRLECIATF